MRARSFLAGGAPLLCAMLVLPGPLVASAQEASPQATPGTALEVPLTNADGQDVGQATFTEDAGGVRLVIDVEGLGDGAHGWHLHAMGMCDPSGLEAFSTAGPHWNPTAQMHGAPDAEHHHAGDFGNITVDANGHGHAEITTSDYTLSDGPTSVQDADGTAIIIHDGEDDLVSQPSGNSGGRYACGVVAEPEEMMAPSGSGGAPTPEAEAEGVQLSPELVPFSDDLLQNLQVPEDFSIEVYAQGLTNPRMLGVSPDGLVYVTETSANTVRLLRDTDGDGTIDEAQVVSANLPYVHGITFHDGRAWLAGEKTIWAADVLDDGTLGELQTIVDDLPEGDQHGRHTIHFGPDGLLYVSIGSSCNACAETDPENATLLRMNPDGSDREIFAAGLRNTIGWAWSPETGDLWGMDHGSDWRGDEQPPEELNLLQANRNYGWPYCFGDQEVDKFLSYPPVGATPEQYCANTEAPVLTYDAHSAPIAMVFYDGTQFPEEYANDAFVAMRGSWNRSEPVGYKVVRIHFENGQPTEFEDFVSGWLLDDGAGQFGRVAGLAVAPDGSLLVTDDSNGVIYRVTYTGDASATPASS